MALFDKQGTDAHDAKGIHQDFKNTKQPITQALTSCRVEYAYIIRKRRAFVKFFVRGCSEHLQKHEFYAILYVEMNQREVSYVHAYTSFARTRNTPM